MKRIFCIPLLLLFCNMIMAIQILYVPKNDAFEISNQDINGKSVNEVVELCGYSPGQFYLWDAREESLAICFKILSQDIICIISNRHLGNRLGKEKVQRLLNDYEFDYSYEYPPYSLESDLKKGIEKKSLKLSFIEEATHKKAKGNEIIDDFNGYIYTFNDDGYMISYKSSDGYTLWAKEYKDTDFFEKIKLNAERNNSTKEDVIAEINMQCDYRANILTNYLDLGENQRYNYNYALLYVDLNCPRIQLKDFNNIVHHKATNIRKDKNQSPIMLYKGKKYYFNFEDCLVRIE